MRTRVRTALAALPGARLACLSVMKTARITVDARRLPVRRRHHPVPHPTHRWCR